MNRYPDSFIKETLMHSFREEQSYKGYQLVFKGYDVNSLEKIGILERQPYVDAVNCPWCGKSRPVRTKRRKDGTLDYYCVCKKCRPTQIDPKTLLWWQIHREPFIRIFIDAVGIQGEMEELIPNNLWKLGRCGNTPFYLIRNVETGPELKVLIESLSKHPKSVLVTFLNSVGESLATFFPNPILVMNDITSFNNEGYFSFDIKTIEKYAVPETNKMKRTIARRGSRMSNFEKLIHELEEHVISCYSYILETGRCGEADVLPPPTQKQLARMTGLSEVAVSRCLNDKGAPQDLRELYENIRTVRGVESLYKIIKYRRSGQTASLSALFNLTCDDNT